MCLELCLELCVIDGDQLEGFELGHNGFGKLTVFGICGGQRIEIRGVGVSRQRLFGMADREGAVTQSIPLRRGE